MIGKEEDVQKLKDILRKKFPNLSNEEIEKNTIQLIELAIFLVHQRTGQHPKHTEKPKEEFFKKIVREPP